jgi:hypothetical protein
VKTLTVVNQKNSENQKPLFFIVKQKRNSGFWFSY